MTAEAAMPAKIQRKSAAKPAVKTVAKGDSLADPRKGKPWFGGRVSAKKLTQFTTQLSVLQNAGITIVRRAIQAPLRQIAENAGVDGAVVAGKVLESDVLNFGFNAQTEEYGDMFSFGVIDPAKVVRTALEDAASVAGLLITTEAMVADKPAPAGPPAGGGMPDMGGMGGMM